MISSTQPRTATRSKNATSLTKPGEPSLNTAYLVGDQVDGWDVPGLESSVMDGAFDVPLGVLVFDDSRCCASSAGPIETSEEPSLAARHSLQLFGPRLHGGGSALLRDGLAHDPVSKRPGTPMLPRRDPLTMVDAAEHAGHDPDPGRLHRRSGRYTVSGGSNA